jgi:hypothetical protein
MPNTASRLSANGSLTINGSFDEVSSTYVSSGLIGSWDANRSYYPEIDASIWYDTSGNNNIRIYNNNGTPALFSPSSNSANITFFTTNGSSVALGSYGLVTIPQLATTANVTIEGVFNIRQLVGMVGGFGVYDIYFAGGNFGFNTAGGDIFGISAATVTSLNLLNRNVHYVFVMPTSNLPGAYQLWINGVQQSLSLVVGTSVPATRAYNSQDGTYTFQLNGWYRGTPINGTLPAGGTYYGNVSWSSFRMYNRVLTPAEIRQNYNIASARYRLGSTINPIVTATISNNTTQIIRQTISGEFDEVTYNPTSNVRVNTLLNSQQFNLSSWGTYQATVSANVAVAPDGTTTAFSLNEDTSNGEHLLAQFRTGRDETMTASYYAKAAARTRCYISLSNYVNFSCQIHYDLIAGTITLVTANNSDYSNISGTITPVGNGWFRCTLTATKGSVNSTNSFTIAPVVGASSVYLGTGVPAIYVWGAQFEQSASPSIYVRTGANAIIANTFNQRTVNTGNTYVRGIYDEVSKTLPIEDSSLIVNLDPSYDISYSGTGTTCFDISGNKNHATINGSVTFDTYNSAFNLNGGYLSIPTSASLNTISTAVTASVWVNPTQFISGNFSRIISRDSFPTQNWYIEQAGGIHANKGSIFSYDGRTAVSGPVLAINTWYNITMTSSNTITALYVNGNLHGSTATSTFKANTAGIGIGSDANGGSSLLCKIGTVQVYNRALTAPEILTNVNAQRIRYGV